jgi:flagellar export protein FliJ
VKRFRFRLEQLLELRRYREHEWELKLAEITGIVVSIENRIRTIDNEVKRALVAQFTYIGRPDYNFLIASEEYISRLRLEKSLCEVELQTRREERKKVQKVYLEHSKKHKVLKRLKERQEETYYRQKRNEEAKVLDDMNISAFIRKKTNKKRGE